MATQKPLKLAVLNTVLSVIALVVLGAVYLLAGTSSLEGVDSTQLVGVRLASRAPAIPIAALIVGWIAYVKGKPAVIKICLIGPWIYLIVLLLLLRG